MRRSSLITTMFVDFIEKNFSSKSYKILLLIELINFFVILAEIVCIIWKMENLRERRKDDC